MKKVVTSILLMMTAALYSNEDVQVITLNEVSQTAVEQMMSGDYPNIILECAEGTVLPITFAFKSDFLSLETSSQAPLSLRILKSCYMKNDHGVFMFSDEGVHWKDFFDYFTGSFGLYLLAENQVPFINIDAELYRR